MLILHLTVTLTLHRSNSIRLLHPNQLVINSSPSTSNHHFLPHNNFKPRRKRGTELLYRSKHFYYLISFLLTLNTLPSHLHSSIPPHHNDVSKRLRDSPFSLPSNSLSAIINDIVNTVDHTPPPTSEEHDRNINGSGTIFY